MAGTITWHVVDRAVAAINPADAIAAVSDPGFGGIDVFIGKVRNLNQGRAVQGITYDLFEPLVLAGFARMAEDVRARFGPRVSLYIAHAKGRLAVGDVAVVVAAGTPHRGEAFAACRELIEQVKHHSPVWKQEHYEDGDSVWSEGCTLCHADDVPAIAAVASKDLGAVP